MQTAYAASVVASGSPQTLTIAPPSGTPWTTGDTVILFTLKSQYNQPTPPSGASQLGANPPSIASPNGAPQIVVYAAPIYVGTQAYPVGAMEYYSRVFGYESSPADELVFVSGAATLDATNNVITLAGIPDFSAAAGYRAGAHLVGAFNVAASPTGASGGTVAYVAGTSTGARIVSKAPATTNSANSELYDSGFMFDIDQTGTSIPATFSTEGLQAGQACLWAGVIVNPKYAQPLSSDVRCAAV